MSALASSQTDTGGASTGSTTLTTNTEAIIAAATSAEAAAAVAQEQGATLVTVHPAVIETPVDGAEGGNEGEENEGDGEIDFALHCLLHSKSLHGNCDVLLQCRFLQNTWYTCFCTSHGAVYSAHVDVTNNCKLFYDYSTTMFTFFRGWQTQIHM